MKHIRSAYIPGYKVAGDMASISTLLNQAERQLIDNLLWSTDGYKPQVSFTIAYTDSSILLKYFVAEQHVKADYHKPNDPVYKDSCVEFFIAFDNDKKYYNLEFNSIGTCLIAYGSDKNNRLYIDGATIGQIQTYYTNSKLGTSTDTGWELTLAIPFTLFIHHNITSLTNMQCNANFYKCGDGLPQPHYLSWNVIDYPLPNFHLPEFFGSLHFL